MGRSRWTLRGPTCIPVGPRCRTRCCSESMTQHNVLAAQVLILFTQLCVLLAQAIAVPPQLGLLHCQPGVFLTQLGILRTEPGILLEVLHLCLGTLRLCPSALSLLQPHRVNACGQGGLGECLGPACCSGAQRRRTLRAHDLAGPCRARQMLPNSETRYLPADQDSLRGPGCTDRRMARRRQEGWCSRRPQRRLPRLDLEEADAFQLKTVQIDGNFSRHPGLDRYIGTFCASNAC
mmetsp:Transcript_17341/g.47881  ORF Transcript_17341/g.47881 Transcript_17341/m.47881 type:complete len:235 (-) Transcript_17341:209-913(-)